MGNILCILFSRMMIRIVNRMFGFKNDSFQPVQLYQQVTENYQCHLFPAHPSLQDRIHYYWILKVSAESLQLPILPDNSLDLVITIAGGTFTGLYFPQSQAFHIPIKGPVSYFGICMQPHGACQLFAKPMETLQALNQGKETEQALLPEDLLTTLRGPEAAMEKVAAVDRFFLSRLGINSNKQNQRYTFVDADQMLSETMALMAKQLHVSERQLRRISGQLFGMGPKKIHRVLRLQKLLKDYVLANTDTQRSDLYYDDAHMSRELKALTGLGLKELQNMAEKYN